MAWLVALNQGFTKSRFSHSSVRPLFLLERRTVEKGWRVGEHWLAINTWFNTLLFSFLTTWFNKTLTQCNTVLSETFILCNIESYVTVYYLELPWFFKTSTRWNIPQGFIASMNLIQKLKYFVLPGTYNDKIK